MGTEFSIIDNILFSFLPTVLASFLTWFFTRKKYQEEVKANEIDNTKEVIAIWKEMAFDLRKEQEATLSELKQSKEVVATLEEKIKDLEKRLFKFENEHK